MPLVDTNLQGTDRHLCATFRYDLQVAPAILPVSTGMASTKLALSFPPPFAGDAIGLDRQTSTFLIYQTFWEQRRHPLSCPWNKASIEDNSGEYSITVFLLFKQLHFTI